MATNVAFDMFPSSKPDGNLLGRERKFSGGWIGFELRDQLKVSNVVA